MAKRRTNNKRKNRNRRPVKERSALIHGVKMRRRGAGAHSDKRLRRNSKGRKYDTNFGWE